MRYPNSKAFLFWLGLLIVTLLVMVRPASANTYSIILGNGQICDGAASSTQTFATPQLAMAGFVASWPRNCMVGGVLHYLQTASGFVLTSNTSLTYNIGAVAANQWQGGSAAVSGVVKTWTENAVACPAAETSAGSYWISTGTLPNSIYTVGLGLQCKAGCQTKQVTTIDVMSSSQNDGIWKIVDGVRQFYSYRSYYYTGLTCTGDTQAAAATVPSSETCAAGQSIIQMGSKIACIDPATGAQVNPNSASAVAAAKTLADAKAAKAIADAKAAAQAAGLSASAVEAAGAAAANTSTTINNAAPVSGFTPGDPMAAFCVDNPQASVCKQNTTQAKTGSALPSLGTGSWYVKTYPQGVGGVMTANFNTMKATPLYGLLGHITPTISATASNGCFSLPVFNMGNQPLCIPSGLLTFIGICMVLTALFSARAIIFGG